MQKCSQQNLDLEKDYFKKMFRSSCILWRIQGLKDYELPHLCLCYLRIHLFSFSVLEVLQLALLIGSVLGYNFNIALLIFHVQCSAFYVISS